MAAGGNQDLRNVTGRLNSSRLPSMRSPRDLNLGHVNSRGTSRANIVPNLNLGRKKPTPQVPLDVPKPPEPKKARERGRGRGWVDRGRGRGRPSTPNLGGTIFDQGIAEAPRLPTDDTEVEEEDNEEKKFRTSASSSSSGHGVVVHRETSTEGDDCLGVLRSLVDYKPFIDDGKVKDEITPILVPLGCEERSSFKEEIKPSIKQEVLDVDDQPSYSGRESPMQTTTETKSAASILEESLLKMESDDFARNKSNDRPEFNWTTAEILEDAEKHDKMVILKVPDVLPLVPIQSAEPGKYEAEKAAEEGSRKAEKKEVPITTFFRDYPEGPVGKLRVRKSGKVELVIGENVLEVKPGAPVNMFTEAVAVRLEASGGHMSVLGNVGHKLVVCPNFTSMMTQSPR